MTASQIHPPAPAIEDPLRDGLVLLAAQFGRMVTIAQLGDGLPLVEGRLPLDQAPTAMRRAGLSARAVTMRVEDAPTALLPVLLILKSGEARIWLSKEGDEALLLAPESGGGCERLPMSQLSALHAGVIIFARPLPYVDTRADDYAKSEPEHWIRSALSDVWPSFIEVAVAAIVANLLAVGTSLFAMQVYDRVVPTSSFDTLWILASGVILAILAEFALRLLRAHLLDVTGRKLDLRLSARLFEQVMQIRLSAKPGSTGAFSSQVREFEAIREFFTATTVAAISDAPFILGFLAIIAMLGGPVAWAPAVAALLMLIPGLVLQKKLAALSRENLREGAVKHGLLLETVDNLEGVKATRAEGRNLRLWESLSLQLADAGLRTRRISSTLGYAASSIQQLAYVGVVVIGVYQIAEGRMTMGALIACSMLVSRAVAPMAQSTGILARWQHVKIALEGLDNLMRSPVERPSDRQFTRKPDVAGGYRIEGVQIAPEGLPTPILDIPRLRIEPGEHVAVIGGIGAGKSMLLRLLSGLGDATTGRILLDDVSLAQIDPADRRRAIGYLPQDTALFHGTLRDNLTLDGGAHSDADLFAALDGAGLGAFVRSHPLGLDLPIIGRQGVSGGQRQAIGLARLFLQDPRVVLMDEPTAAYDQGNEQRVVAYLKRWTIGRTLVVATHKRALLSVVDRVLVLSGGRVVDDGSTDTILSRSVTPGRSAANG